MGNESYVFTLEKKAEEDLSKYMDSNNYTRCLRMNLQRNLRANDSLHFCLSLMRMTFIYQLHSLRHIDRQNYPKVFRSRYYNLT